MNKVRSVLSESLGIDEDALENDPELKNTIDNLAVKMSHGKNPADELTGEYEVLKNSEYLFLINLIHSLKDDGIMAVCLSQGFLNKNSLEILRKYLTFEKNYIDCIISLPDELSKSKRPEVIVVFRKNKTSDDIVFIDLSSKYNTVPSRYRVSGTFNKNLLLTRETQDKVICVYNKRKTVDKFSNVVPLRDLAKNEFNLSTSRYVDTFEGEFVRLEDLKNQKEQITANIKKLNKKIDMMMDDLGIDF
jgi:type I restriction enzyme M protein